MRTISTRTPLIDNFVKAFDYYKSKSDKTGRDIANHLNTSAPTVSNWGAGKHLPDMNTLQKLADYLHAPVSQFFNFTALTETESEDQKDLIALIKTLPDEDIKVLGAVALRLKELQGEEP